MKRHGRAAAIWMPELLVRTALPQLDKAELPEKRHNFARFKNWRLAHELRHFDGLCADEHAVESRIALLEEHFDHFLEIGTQFVERLALAVRAGKTWHPPHVQTGVRVSFDDGSKMSHDVALFPSDDTRKPRPRSSIEDAAEFGWPGSQRRHDVRVWDAGLQYEQLMSGNPDAPA